MILLLFLRDWAQLPVGDECENRLLLMKHPIYKVKINDCCNFCEYDQLKNEAVNLKQSLRELE